MLKKAYNRFSTYCDTHVNPIVLKELRQSFNTKGLIWGMVVLLLIMLVITAFMIASARNPENISGSNMFLTFFVIMGLCCCFSIIPMGGYRHNREIFGEQLFNMSGLSPRQLLNGKLTSMLIEVGLIIFLMVPFMAMAYMFQGLLVQTIFQGIFIFVLVVVLLALFYLCMGSFHVKQMSGLVLIGSVIICPFLLVALIGASRTWSFWGTPKLLLLLDCTMLLYALKYAIFLYTATYTLLSPPSWNRATPLRLVITILCLVQGISLIILSLPFCHKYYNDEFKSMLTAATVEWFTSFFIFAIILLFCAILFQDQTRQSRRMHKTIPRNVLGRLVYFPFFPGEANGIVFSILMAASLVMGSSVIVLNLTNFAPSSDFLGVMIFFLIPYFYFLGAHILSMIKLPGTKEQRFIFALLTLAIGINATPIYYFFRERQAELWKGPFSFLMGYSYLGLDKSNFHRIQIPILFGSILLLTIICLPSFIQSFIKFHRLDDDEIDMSTETDS
jgi:hypothetical protein